MNTGNSTGQFINNKGRQFVMDYKVVSFDKLFYETEYYKRNKIPRLPLWNTALSPEKKY
jgi:hypothetical protein